MMSMIIGFTITLAVMSPSTVYQGSLEPMSVREVRENASYYDEKEIAVSGYVVDSHIEWYSDSRGDYMTWNLLISDDRYPDELSQVLLCYESGFNIERIRECSEIGNIHKDLARRVTVVGEYDTRNGVLNLRKFVYFEKGEPCELDTDVGDREQVRVYRHYDRDFDYDIHYVVWHRYSYIWPHPIWWIWWEPVYVLRPPTRYVVYYTPWRTYRRRVRPVRRDNVIRVDPRDSHRVVRRGPARVGSRVATERVRVTPRGGSPPATPRVRVSPERSSPPARARVAPGHSSSSSRVRPQGLRRR